jgi:hypothetical protein
VALAACSPSRRRRSMASRPCTALRSTSKPRSSGAKCLFPQNRRRVFVLPLRRTWIASVFGMVFSSGAPHKTCQVIILRR